MSSFVSQSQRVSGVLLLPTNRASNLANSAANATRNAIHSATDSIAYSADTLSKSLTNATD